MYFIYERGLTMDKGATEGHLQRGLKERHIQLIAIGGAIGVGLFLGSSVAIKTAGPALLLSYLIGGIAIFIMMRALGEMAVANPVSGSFGTYAYQYVSPLAGFITGWTYWFMWVVTCMAEITAAGIYMTYWFPESPQWIWALVSLLIMTGVNLINVKAYGEIEFWFAMIKVITILAMIFIGGAMILFGIGNNGVALGFSNLYSHGGFFPKGILGPVMACTMVSFAYLGIELIGVTAGEAENPEKTIPSAIDKVFWRILIFYIGALVVIMSIFPWDEIGTKGSPFVLTFERIGIRTAAGIINFVVLTAALSSCNSGIYSNGRMLYNLALQKKAPAVFRKINTSGVPVAGVLVSSAFLFIGVVLNYLLPEKVFVYVTSIATVAALWVWTIVLVAQINFRKSLSVDEVKKLKYPMFWWPYSSYISLAFWALVLVMLAFQEDTRISMYVAPFWFALLIGTYYFLGFNKSDQIKG